MNRQERRRLLLSKRQTARLVAQVPKPPSNDEVLHEARRPKGGKAFATSVKTRKKRRG